MKTSGYVFRPSNGTYFYNNTTCLVLQTSRKTTGNALVAFIVVRSSLKVYNIDSEYYMVFGLTTKRTWLFAGDGFPCGPRRNCVLGGPLRRVGICDRISHSAHVLSPVRASERQGNELRAVREQQRFDGSPRTVRGAHDRARHAAFRLSLER